VQSLALLAPEASRKSADERQSLETKPIPRGTESSNPVPSSGESVANLQARLKAKIAGFGCMPSSIIWGCRFRAR
jgi:hypothetical protein